MCRNHLLALFAYSILSHDKNDCSGSLGSRQMKPSRCISANIAFLFICSCTHGWPGCPVADCTHARLSSIVIWPAFDPCAIVDCTNFSSSLTWPAWPSAADDSMEL